MLSAAEQLGFQPNKSAVALNSGRTRTVGMITTDTIGRFSIPLMMGAEDALGADLPIPVVYAFISSTDPRDCSVVPDEAGGARKAVDHLLAVGRTRIAHITGPEHHHSVAVRAAAAAARLREAGLPVGPPLFGEWSEAWGRQAVKILLGSGDFDAVFCGSDQIARGVADGLRAAGRRVPDDAARQAIAAAAIQAMVDMELAGLGRAAAKPAAGRRQRRAGPGRHTHSCRLVIRDSTAV